MQIQFFAVGGRVLTRQNFLYYNNKQRNNHINTRKISPTNLVLQQLERIAMKDIVRCLAY
jgi:hypothetical protein